MKKSKFQGLIKELVLVEATKMSKNFSKAAEAYKEVEMKMQSLVNNFVAEKDPKKKAKLKVELKTLTQKKKQIETAFNSALSSEPVELEEAKVRPTDDTIRFHIDAYRVDDDPYEVAQEIGKEYGWTEREIQKAEKIIRKKYIKESVNEGKDKWVVYDIKTKKRLPNAGKTWATMKAADAFAAKQKNAKVASAEFYFDKIQESVDEASMSKLIRAAKKGSYPVTLVVIEKGKVVKQELVGTPQLVPAAFNTLQKEYPNATIHIESKTGERLFSESINEDFPGKGETVKAKDLNYDILDYFNRMNISLSINTKSKKNIKGSVGKMFNDLVFNGGDIDKKDILSVKIVGESLNYDISNAKNQLKDPHTIKDIEYRKTRSRGDKFVKIIYTKDYVPGKMMDTGPHFVSIFYNDDKELQKIGKTLKLKLKEELNEAVGIGTIAAAAIGAGILFKLGLMSDAKLQKTIDTAKGSAKEAGKALKMAGTALARELPIIGKKIKKKELTAWQLEELQKYVNDEVTDKDVIESLSQDPELKRIIDEIAAGSSSYRKFYGHIKRIKGNPWANLDKKFIELRKKLKAGEIEESATAKLKKIIKEEIRSVLQESVNEGKKTIELKTDLSIGGKGIRPFSDTKEITLKKGTKYNVTQQNGSVGTLFQFFDIKTGKQLGSKWIDSLKPYGVYESVNEAAYKNATNNELAQYIINLSNEKAAAKSRGNSKEVKYLEKDIEELKKELKSRKKK